MQPHITPGISVRRPGEHLFGARDERTLSVGEPAGPFLKVLPIKRWIPQDVHSVMDYVDGLAAATGFFLPQNRRDDAAAWASIALGASVVGMSMVSDYRLSVAKVIPIRAHEALDYAWGAACIAAPFVLGYWKKSPRVAFTHIAVGAVAIVASLFTDYRSYAKRTAKPAATRVDEYDAGL
jgi:hypothetical protein